MPTSPPQFASETSEGVILRLRVQPKAKRTKVVGPYGDRLKVMVNAPPVDGKANQALQRFLAKTLGVSKGSILLKSGESSRDKTLLIQGVRLDTVLEKLGP